MNDDLISRQAAIDALNGGFTVTGRENAETIMDFLNGVCKKLRDLPSAERRGRWIMPQKYNNEYRCSVCGEITKRDRTPFCGWCGAKMDEVHVMQDDLYPCDPDKNDRCTKNSCYRNGGDCYLTKFEDYRK